MKILLLFILICSIIFSCRKEKCSEGEDCASNELLWLPYQNGQILIFKNDSPEIDTLSVVKNAYYRDATFSNDECSRFQVVEATFPVKNDFLKIEVIHYVGIPKVRAEANLQTSCCRNFISDSPDTSQIIIDSIHYSNLRLLLPYYAHDTSNISNVYYSKIKGIVSFQSPDGNRWHLIN